MAKAIISSILEAQLGKYVDGLSSDSLQLGLWSGEIVLQSLSLKPHAFAELELPVTVVRGSVRRIHVVVPWNQLGSASVRVTLEGVNALVAPNAQLPTRAELQQAKASAVERQELRRRHDRFAAARNGDSHSDRTRVDESTFLSRLTERIVDNLQVTLRDVHVRYEDSVSNPAAPFACGVMVQSFAFHTTDAEGRDVFLDRTAATNQQKATAFVHKAVTVTQLGVYWDRLGGPHQPPLQHAPDIEHQMAAMVRDMATPSSRDRHAWLLRPCSVAVQLTKNESQDYARVAKFTVQATLQGVALGLARSQYEDMWFVHQAFDGRRAIETHFRHGRCRPFHSAYERPREWWDYATRLVLAAQRATRATSDTGAVSKRTTQRLRWSTVARAGAERRAYVTAFRAQLRKRNASTTVSAEGLDAFEMTYPVDVVMAVRDAAEDDEEAAEREKKRREHSATATGSHAGATGGATGGSWYDYFFSGAKTTATATATLSSPSSTDEFADVLTAQGRADLKQAYDDVATKAETPSVPPGCNLVSVKLQLKGGSLALFQAGQRTPFFVASADGSLALNVQPSDEWDARFRLQRFEVVNASAAADSAFRTFCSLSSAAKVANPKLPCVSFDASLRTDSDSATQSTFKLRVSAVPIRVMVDPSFVLRVQDFFASLLPEQQLDRVWSFATSSVADWIFSDQEDELLATTLQSTRPTMRYDVAIDMRAPVFVVPEDVSDAHASVVVVDLGQFSFMSDPGREEKRQQPVTPSDATPATLCWRLDITNVQLLLGRLHDVDWVADADFQRFATLVEQLNLAFGVETLAPTLTLRPSKERAAAAPTHPTTSVHATIPQIAVSLAEDQLVALARIHSSILAQVTLAGRHRRQQLVLETTATASPATATRQGEHALSHAPREATSASPTASADKYHLHVQVSLGEIELNLRESATRDAFRLCVTQTSFDAAVFASQYVLHARLQSLLMEDMLYDPSSCFRQLMATGATSDATTHLVAIDVTMYPSSHGVVDREREATFMIVDMKVNVLDVQWNPSSMSLLYRLTTTYVVALQHHRIDSDAFDASGPLVANEAATVEQTTSDSGTTPVEPPPVAVAPLPASNPTASQVPSILARASLVQFSVTFNKDDMNRQLVQLAMKDASVEYASHDASSYAWRGHVGNFIATDLSMAKHPVYSPLVGLDETSSSSSSSDATALLAFSYAFDQSTSDKSVLSLQFQPVRMVYYHQQVLELSDYLFEGILGTMVSHTLFNATQLLLRQTEASVVFQVAFEKPTVLLPVRMADPNHIRITAELLSLRHFPTSAVHYVGTNDALATRRRVVAPGEALASRVVCRSDCTSFRLDYKQISLKRVNIVYVSEAPVSSTSSVTYDSVVARPMDLVVDVEDLASADVRVGDGPFLPRFSIRVAMAELELLLQRRHYVLFVGVLTENFGAEQLQVASSSPADTHDNDSSATRRPNVSYSYSRTDLEAVTMELGFSMKRLQCVLYEDDSSVHSSGDADDVARVALSGVGRPSASATSEILASDFSVSLNFLRDADPSVTVGVASFVVRALDDRTTGETTGDRRHSEPFAVSSESPGVLLVCTHPTQASYSWDPTQLTCALELNLSKATGVLIPEATAGLVDFFAVPTASETRSSPPVLSRSESSGGSQRVTRRHSITELGRDARGVAYAMTVRLSATQLAVDVPQDLESVDSPRLSLRADLSAEYTWKPASADAQNAAAAAADFDIQSSLVVDARAIEVVVKNANRQGCYASHPSDGDSDSAGTSRVAVATLVQLLEPCDLHAEVSDLFPHAGQKQQIVAFRFTPIELFVSYDDMCLGVATLRTMSDSVARYERKQSPQRGDAATLVVGAPPPAAGVLSPKTFAAPSVGESNLELHRYFTCEASSMRLTVINDCDGCDMGLLQMHMQRCNAFLNVTYAPTPVANASFPPPSTVISGGGGVVMMMSYYNPDTRTWHQLCREWGLDISLQGSIFTSDTPTTLSSDASSSRASDNELHIIVTANQPLDLLVTHGLLEVVASAGGAWNRRASGASSPVADMTKHAPCVISNDTGLSVRFWLTNGHATTAAEVVWTGEMADLHYMHTVGRGSGVVRKYASSDRADNMRLCVALEDASFQPVQGIIFEQLGSRAFSLVDVSGSLSPFTLNCHAKLVDGRILLSLSSQMKVVNNLSMPVQLLVNDPTWRSPVDIGVLYPCRESAIPVLLSLGSELRVRPVDDAFAWSAPIPVQTRSAVAQQVEAAGATGVGVPSAIFCVSMTIEQSLRVVCLSEPIVIVNKLPVALEYRVKSPLRQHAPASTATTLSVGAKSGVWWSDSAQRPLFQLTVDGCKPSKWLELVHPGTKPGAVVSVLLERRDGRAFKLLVHVVEAAARSMHVFLYAEVWFVNRTGLDLVYGNETDTEAYAPPLAARALVGNAQICAFSSGTDAGSGPPVVRIRMRATRWSARFTADPRKLSWQDECLSLRSEPRASADSVGSGMLYELGVSADYATRHFGALTTLVSVIPRYLVRNHTPYTVLLLESSVHSSAGGNAAHHVLASGDVYALYWVTGARSQVHVSVVGAPSEYGWSSAVGVDVAVRDVVLPAAAQSAQPLTLQVAVKRGSLSQATFVVEISDTPTGGGSAGSPAASPISHATATALAASAHAGWDTFSVHTQIAGVIVTVADKNETAENGSVPTVSGDATDEHVARLTISRISLESNVSRHGTSAKMNVMGVKVEDLLALSKNPVVLRPVFRTSATTTTTTSNSSTSGAGKYFLEVAYVEKPHAKYLYVESVRVELQDVKITTSMRFVDRLHALANETVSHFQRRSLAAASQAATTLLEAQETDASEQLLAYFAASDDDTSLASLTGRKVYIASCTVEPVRVVVSFSRDKHDARRQRQAAASALGGGGLPSQSFWLAHLKLEIENACLTLGAYRLTHALATQEALVASLAGFYVASVKSQALGLLESVQVTSLVTSMVAGGVSSLVNTLVGKTTVPSLTTRQHHFQYAFLTNAQIVAKHAQLLSQCRSSTDFVTQLRHLVYDWDSNHTGLEARGCVALGLVNNSRHALVVNTRLNDGADLRVLPIGRRTLAGVATDDTMAFGRNEWRPDRALVVFAYGYTPTLVTSGDVYFTVQSNACNVFATRKTARVVANGGYTATFTHQETQTWWASHVVIVGDDIQARAPAARLSIDSSVRADSMADSAGYDLFGGGDSDAATRNDDDSDEYEVVFTSASLGLIAKQSGGAVIVRELCALPSGAPGPALATGEIAPGDSILSVSGMRVTNTTQFAQLVGQSPRPVVLRFRRTSEQAAYNLFGETAASRSSRSREVSGASSDSDDFNLFGK